jgi:putative transposase
MTLYRDKYRIETTRYRARDYRSRGWYFVTICSHEKAHIFGEVIGGEMRLSRIGSLAETELRHLSTHYKNVVVDSQVVMPNHVHAIIVIEGEHAFSPHPKGLPSLTGISPACGSLSAIVRSYKAGVTRQCHELGLKQTIWQARFYDRILRGDANISAVREYIWNNPGNWTDDSENRHRTL